MTARRAPPRFRQLLLDLLLPFMVWAERSQRFRMLDPLEENLQHNERSLRRLRGLGGIKSRWATRSQDVAHADSSPG